MKVTFMETEVGDGFWLAYCNDWVLTLRHALPQADTLEADGASHTQSEATESLVCVLEMVCKALTIDIELEE